MPPGPQITHSETTIKKMQVTLKVPASGMMDDATVAALKKFQEAHDTTPTGLLDAPTFLALGLSDE
jgi:hypothetical protein